MSTTSSCGLLIGLGLTQSERMTRFLQMLRSDEEPMVIKNLKGDDTQLFIDFAQQLLDGAFPRSLEPDLYRKACKLVDDLCGTACKLPTALFVTEGTLNHKLVDGGGFSDIFICEKHSGLPQFAGPVALKRLRHIGDADPSVSYKALSREALACRRLRHPSVLEFLGIDNKTFPEPHFCLLSPFLQNGTIMQYRQKLGPANIFIDSRILEIAEGLQYAHSESLVHGDLHPGNILIDDEGHAKLADFGLATFINATTTESHGSKSSPKTGPGAEAYMAPEQLASRMESETCKLRKKSEKTNIFAFASVCYALYCGQGPFHDKKSRARMRSLLSIRKNP
ncbi:kinase-like domain-containing protein [Mycena galopus ATCC 62051]|nr:kinase-like domain-containing protein [Mycena galopus ATCC 62051]